EDNPGSLERQQYIDVVAYIFSLNAYPAGENDLPADDDGLKKIKIDNPPSEFSLRQALRYSANRSLASRAVAHPRVTFRKERACRETKHEQGESSDGPTTSR